MIADAFADYPKTVVLKDGEHVILRPFATVEDAALRALLARAAPPERLVPGDDPIIVAWVGERAVAAAALERYLPKVARLSVAIDPEYRGKRLGTWLVLDGVHLAAGLGAERLEANAPSGDVAYLAALERLDFGVDAARTSPASVMLVKRLHRGWTDF